MDGQHMLVPLSNAAAPWANGITISQPRHVPTQTRLLRILLFSSHRQWAWRFGPSSPRFRSWRVGSRSCPRAWTLSAVTDPAGCPLVHGWSPNRSRSNRSAKGQDGPTTGGHWWRGRAFALASAKASAIGATGIGALQGSKGPRVMSQQEVGSW